MTILKSFHRTAYEILPHMVVKDYKGEDFYQVFHFYNDDEIFFEFFKVAFQPGSTALDCGLNFGLHTDMFLSLGAKSVVAFEASREVLKKVTKKYSDNQSVTIISKALSNEVGSVLFHECNASGASSLRETRDIRKYGGYRYEVECTTLDDEPALSKAKNISCIKIDLEGADMPALVGGRELIKRHQPYIIMEYVDTLTEYAIDGSKLTKYSILDICNDIDYVPFNLYGVCVLDPDIFEESIFEDMNDLILVPKSKLTHWTTMLLPKYQYAVFEKLFERIELYDKFPGNLSIMSMCKRIYREVNNKKKAEAISFMGVVRKNLLRIVENVNEIDANEDLKQRGALLLKLIYGNFFEEAYKLAQIKTISESEIVKFQAFYDTNVKR